MVIIMDTFTQYYEKITGLLTKIHETQKENVDKAARMIAEQIKLDKRLVVFGTGGHCTRVAEEMFWKAGGFACTQIIMDAGLQLVNGATRASKTERMHGYADVVLDYYGVCEDDLVLLVSAYGIGAVTIEAALGCKERGATVIAITSHEFPTTVADDHPARHKSKKNLFEIVDHSVDSFVPGGDSIVEIPGYDFTICSSSTLLGVFVVNSVTARAVEIMLEMGVEPPIWVSANAPGGDALNKRLIAKYRNTRHL